jgi:hypothetical protein
MRNCRSSSKSSKLRTPPVRKILTATVPRCHEVSLMYVEATLPTARISR